MVADIAIGIVVRAGKVLIARRHAQAALGGLWEFPGGKCEAGEPPHRCVVRELEEETGLHVRTTHAMTPITHAYDHGTIRLHPFLCAVVGGEARAAASQEIRWVDPSELSSFRFPPANASMHAELTKLLAGPLPTT